MAIVSFLLSFASANLAMFMMERSPEWVWFYVSIASAVVMLVSVFLIAKGSA